MDRVKLHKLLDAVLDLFEEETTTDESALEQIWRKNKKSMPSTVKNTDESIQHDFEVESAQPSGREVQQYKYLLRSNGYIYKIEKEYPNSYDVDATDLYCYDGGYVSKAMVGDEYFLMTEEECKSVMGFRRDLRVEMLNKLRSEG